MNKITFFISPKLLKVAEVAKKFVHFILLNASKIDNYYGQTFIPYGCLV